MPYSNYPNGFPGGLMVRGMPILQTNPGKVFWVSNVSTGLLQGQRGGSNGNKGGFNDPFATLQIALNNCVANRGDIIYIKPGHAETISAATTLLFNKAGAAIVGLGWGANRPLFTFTAAAATIPVSADNISIQNVRFVGNFLSVVSCFTVAAAANFCIDSCDFRDTSAILGFLSIVTTTVAVNSDFLTFTNNERNSIATTTPGPDLVIANTMTGLTVVGNRTFHLVASNNVAALVEHGALVMTEAYIADNFVFSVNTDTATGAILVKTTATTGSGMIYRNRIRALDIAAAIVAPAAAVQYGLFDNLYIGDGTSVSGFVLPAIGSDA